MMLIIPTIMPAKHYSSIDELDDLEESAQDCTTSHRLEALWIVAIVFNANKVDYGLIGGTNFYLRGSDRTTTDVDIAVSGHWSLAEVLGLFDDDGRITRPSPQKPLLWVSGVARIFINVKNNAQLVQVDLKRQTASTHDFAAETELILVPAPSSSSPSSQSTTDAIPVRFFKIAPLVKLKLHAHYIREANKDYHDLRFACLDEKYRSLVKAVSREYLYEERVLFVEKVVENDPGDEEVIRDVLNLPVGGSDGSGSESESESVSAFDT